MGIGSSHLLRHLVSFRLQIWPWGWRVALATLPRIQSLCVLSLPIPQPSPCSSLIGLPQKHLLQPSVSPACSARSAQWWPHLCVYFHAALRLTSDGLGATTSSSCVTCTPSSKTQSLWWVYLIHGHLPQWTPYASDDHDLQQSPSSLKLSARHRRLLFLKIVGRL